MTIKILLADKHVRIRESMSTLIDRQPGMEVVGEAKNERTMLQLARFYEPDIVVMDIKMLDLNNIDSARQIISGVPGVKFLVLSMYSNPEFVDGMLKTGVTGYLLKDHTFEELIRAIETVFDDHIYLGPGIEDPTAPASG